MWLLRNLLYYFTLFVVFQLSLSVYLNGFQFSFTELVYLISTGILFLIIVFKIKIKWTGILALNASSEKYGFTYKYELSNKFFNHYLLFYLTEYIISFFTAIIIVFFDSGALLFSLLLFASVIEGCIYLLYSIKGKKFKVAVNDNAVVHNARGVYILPFHDLKRIEFKYNDFFFIYKDDETLLLPYTVVGENEIENLKKAIVEKVKDKGVFYTVKLNQDK